MIKCGTCGFESIIGTLFCTECGAPLLETEQASAAIQWTYAHFLIVDSGRRQKLSLSGSEPVMIGRADPDKGYWPQLDLTDDGGFEKGVSRQHAMVLFTPQNLVIVDQGSANGTWLDDIQLEPEQEYPLPASAKLRFGGLNVFIYLE
jgi:hypothetical protein